MPPRLRLRSLLVPWLAATAVQAHASGVPVGPPPSSGEAQLLPAVLADPTGGALITYKTASGRAGAVHVGPTGVPDGGPGWSPIDLPITLGTSEPLRAGLYAGGRVAIASDHATATAPTLTRLGPGGSTEAGFPVALGMLFDRPALVPGLDGRSLIVAKGSDAIWYWTIRAAIVSASGAVEHAIQLSSPRQFFNADRLEAVTDGAGGLIAVMSYYDIMNTGSKDLGVFRYAADGSRPWGDAPKMIVAVPRDQIDPKLVPDGEGGAYMAWTDPRSATGSSDIYALRIDAAADRSPGWVFYGRAICDAAGEQTQVRIVEDGGTGAWIAWLDQRKDVGDLRYSHVLANGDLAAGFTTDGAVLCDAVGAQRELVVATDGAGGFYAVWRDDRAGESQLYAQHVLGSGLAASGWPAQGRPLVEAPGTQDQPAIAALPGGRVLIAWRDGRSTLARIYSIALDDFAPAAAPLDPPRLLALTADSPARGVVRATCSVREAGAVALELFDLGGRMRERVALIGPLRDVAVTLRPPGLSPGVYLVRLRHRDAQVCDRAVVLR